MKVKVSDFIADYLARNGIVDCFTVTGGGAMHLNDSFGHHQQIKCTYFHHEQAAAMAAEAYARIENNPALVCVTSGPGATNAITGVAGAWLDSIPLIVISGQVRYSTSIHNSERNLRSRGIQEFDIIGSVKSMTKYCALVEDPRDIQLALQKALYQCKNGRPGPCWIDVPLDVQASHVETKELKKCDDEKFNCAPGQEDIDHVLESINKSERPLIYVGNGVRLSGAHDKCLKLIEKTGIPAVCGVSSVDALPSSHPLMVGVSGIAGQRAANFALQNCDLLLSLGSRQSFYQTGFDTKQWAKKAYTILNDIDREELEKENLDPDYKICCDAGALIDSLLQQISSQPGEFKEWVDKCAEWKNEYPVIQKQYYSDNHTNIYVFFRELSESLPDDAIIVVGAGTARVAGSQSVSIKGRQRFIANPSMAAMGYDLPPSIGACIVSGKRTFVITGDGGFQMNIQELQTIKHHNLPIAIFVLNNQGYHSIRMTQKNYFSNSLVGVGFDSGDLSFPSIKRISDAYRFAYYSIENNSDIKTVISEILQDNEPCLCEVKLSTDYRIVPKVKSRIRKNGQMESSGLEDMEPFLSEDELMAIMDDQ